MSLKIWPLRVREERVTHRESIIEEYTPDTIRAVFDGDAESTLVNALLVAVETLEEQIVSLEGEKAELLRRLGGDDEPTDEDIIEQWRVRHATHRVRRIQHYVECLDCRSTLWGAPEQLSRLLTSVGTRET